MGAEIAAFSRMERDMQSASNDSSLAIATITSSSPPRRKGRSFDSLGASEGTGGSSQWGWFDGGIQIDDMYNVEGEEENGFEPTSLQQPIQRSLSLPPPATEPPLYVLESPLPTQHLWYSTAGQRPAQPESERKYYEKLWSENFKKSEISFTTREIKPPQQEDLPEKDFEGDIVWRGKSPFSNAVSKTFDNNSFASSTNTHTRSSSSASRHQQELLTRCWSSVTLQLPRFRIVRPTNGPLHAEFLVVVSLRGIHNKLLTFGVWRRHSSFSELARTIYSSEASSFKNSLLSWECFLNRKKFYRCLDVDYLALKAFLLERFLHDVLFESSSPVIVSEFLRLTEADPQ